MWRLTLVVWVTSVVLSVVFLFGWSFVVLFGLFCGVVFVGVLCFRECGLIGYWVSCGFRGFVCSCAGVLWVVLVVSLRVN